MSNIIKVKRGTTTPTTSNLEEYELGLNITDKKLYTNIDNNIISLNSSNADTLDGINRYQFVRSDISDNFEGDYYKFLNGRIIIGNSTSDNIDITTDTINALNNGSVTDLNLNTQGGSVNINGRLALTEINFLHNQNGYFQLNNGLIIQWGWQDVVPSAQTRVVTFPISFPNALLSVTCQRIEEEVYSSYSTSVGNTSKTGFTYYSNNARYGAFYWISIGY